MAATDEDKLSLKVLVHKEKNKVIFAEADGNFVNTLFSIMALPLGTIVRVLEKCPDENLKGLGSLKNLYQSLMELPEDCFSAEESKFMMLFPRCVLHDSCRTLKLNINETEPTKYFVCQNEGCNPPSGIYYSTSSVARCCKCWKLMSLEIEYMHSPPIGGYHNDGLFVPNAATFIVTDDLRVIPSTLDLSLGLLFSIGFTDASHVEERTIDIGREQMLILVKGALLMNYPLTYLVFQSIHPITIGGLVNPKRGTCIQHLIHYHTTVKHSKTMTLRLSLQKSTSKFLFAEADQDFVDFVFGFLEIPLGTLIGNLMNGDPSFACLENLHASIFDMNSGKWNPAMCYLIRPKVDWKYISENQIFPLDFACRPTIYKCSYVDGTLKSFAPGNSILNPIHSMTFKDPRVGGSFLKSATTFMVLDDLVVTRFSPISAIGILNKFKVPLKDVEHHVVTIGLEKALKILKASLKSNSTLTDVFLEEIIEKKERLEEEFRGLSKNREGPNMEQTTRLKRKK